MAKIDTGMVHRLMQRKAAFLKADLPDGARAALVSQVQAEIDGLLGQPQLPLEEPGASPAADAGAKGKR